MPSAITIWLDAGTGSKPRTQALTKGDHFDREFKLEYLEEKIHVGRSSSSNHAATNNALFDSRVISRRHAELFVNSQTGKLFIMDLVSTHGTFVNGQRLSKMVAQQLEVGDEIAFGKTVENTSRGTHRARTYTLNYQWNTFSTRSKASGSSDEPEKSKQPGSFTVADPSSHNDDDEVEYLGSSINSSLSNTPVSKVSQSQSSSHEPVDLTSDTDEEVKTTSVTPKKTTENKKAVGDRMLDVEAMEDSADDNMYNDDDDEHGEYGVWRGVIADAESETQEDAEDSDQEQDIVDDASFSSVAPSSRSDSPESDKDEDVMDSSIDAVVPSIEEKTPAPVATEQKMKIDNIIAPQDAPATVVEGHASSNKNTSQSPDERTIGLPPFSSIEKASTVSPVLPLVDLDEEDTWHATHNVRLFSRDDRNPLFSTILNAASSSTSDASQHKHNEPKNIDHIPRISTLPPPLERKCPWMPRFNAIGESQYNLSTPGLNGTQSIFANSNASVQTAIKLALKDNLANMEGDVSRSPSSTLNNPRFPSLTSNTLKAFREKIMVARSGTVRQPISLLPPCKTTTATINPSSSIIRATPSFAAFAGRRNAKSAAELKEVDYPFVMTTPSQFSADSSEAAKVAITSETQTLVELATAAASNKTIEDKKRRRTEDEEVIMIETVATAAKTPAAALDVNTSEPSPKRARLTLPDFKLPKMTFPARGLSLARLPAYKPLSTRWPSVRKARIAASPVTKEPASATPTWVASVKPFLFGTLVGSVGIFGALLSMPDMQ